MQQQLKQHQTFAYKFICLTEFITDAAIIEIMRLAFRKP